MQIRQLQYLATLARERHFGRAAEACKISQPALSQALHQIETTFGVSMVNRRHHGFSGFTEEGERILVWARRVLAEHDTLVQELNSVGSGGLSGHIRVGVIPVAMPMVSLLTTAFHRAHPGVKVSVLSQNFMEIERGLQQFEIELGINYLDGKAGNGLRPYVLYDETYYLLAPKNHPVAAGKSITWQDASMLPLCLLTPEMQNRRILNRVFEEVGTVPRTVIETNCAVALCSHVRSGQWFTIVPHTFFYLLGEWRETTAIPLVSPTVSNAVGMLIPERHPLPLVTTAFIEAAEGVSVDRELKKYIP
jgi:DNA-binding transcriptional LysR family regulator